MLNPIHWVGASLIVVIGLLPALLGSIGANLRRTIESKVLQRQKRKFGAMVARYTQALSSEIAVDEFHRSWT